MSSSPVLVEYGEVLGIHGGEKVTVPILAGLAHLQVLRGADEILVPAFDVQTRDRIRRHARELPKGDRSRIKIVDSNGALRRRVEKFLDPLEEWKNAEWPKSAFHGFATDFVYKQLLGEQNRANIMDDEVQTVRDFIPGLDLSKLSTEAREIVVSISRIVCSYVPVTVNFPELRAECPPVSVQEMEEVVRTAEFTGFLNKYGRVGYLLHPRRGFHELRKPLSTFVNSRAARSYTKIAASTADAVASTLALPPVASQIMSIEADKGPFVPSYVPMDGNGHLEVARAALSNIYPGATSPPGCLYAVQYARGVGWLAANDLWRIQWNEEMELRATERARLARAALKRFQNGNFTAMEPISRHSTVKA